MHAGILIRVTVWWLIIFSMNVSAPISMNQFVRQFSSSGISSGRTGCSIVPPVHHRVKIDKRILSPRFPELKYPKNDIRSPSFKPVNVGPDRLKRHYENVLKSDILYMTYDHEAPERIVGSKRREWDGTSAFHINRKLKKPRGFTNAQPDVKKILSSSIPELTSICVNCYSSEASEQPDRAISALLQLQQITGEKPTTVFSKTDVVSWNLRRSRRVGGKVELKGKPMHDFLLTLTELVLPTIPEFKGLHNSCGDRHGNLAFGLTEQQVKKFPEIESNLDSWYNTFGLHIIFKTTAQTDEQARVLMSSMGLPFQGKIKH